MSAAGLGMGLFASSAMAHGHYMSDVCVPRDKDAEPLVTMSDHLKENEHIPKALNNTVFWGHRVKPINDDLITSGGLTKPAAAMYDSISESNWRVRKHSITEACGVFSIDDEDLNAAESETVEELKVVLEGAREEMKDLSPEDRFDRIFSTLFISLRDVNYLTTNLGGADTVKTLPHLLADGEGDCEDFALARYILAVELGMKPDHLAIVFYAHREKNVGHANLAVYNEFKDAWYIVDGTGRPEGYALGGALAYENVQSNMDLLAKIGAYNAGMVPYMAVTRNGFAAFNAYKSIDGTYYDMEPLPEPESHAPLWDIRNPVTNERYATLNGLPYLHHNF
ncbi:MAG: hypothetical protein AB8B83_08810 [Bdellovibrionales bacterium]